MSRNFTINTHVNKNNISDYKIGILKSEWNSNITDLLLNSARSHLLEEGVKKIILISKLYLVVWS